MKKGGEKVNFIGDEKEDFNILQISEKEIVHQNLIALYLLPFSSPSSFMYIFPLLLGQPLNKLKAVSTLCYLSPNAEVNKTRKKHCEKICNSKQHTATHTWLNFKRRIPY